MDFIRHKVKVTESSKIHLKSTIPDFNGTQVLNPYSILDNQHHQNQQDTPTSLPQEQSKDRDVLDNDGLEELKPESETDPDTDPLPVVRHRECLKNHAASTGGHVIDGCGEFMPSGEEGTLGALKCAACQCHRNFHRREIEGEPHHHSVTNSYIAQKFPLLELSPKPLRYHKLSPVTPPSLVPFRPTMTSFNGRGGAIEKSSSEQDIKLGHANSAAPLGVQSKKRVRTKFTQEQKDKMLGFAEKIGWRIQKHDELAVQMFCSEVGIKREVLKVWMHNNKSSSSSMKFQQLNVRAAQES